MQIFRDSIWQFAGVIVSIIAIIVSYIFFIKQRTKKELGYQFISSPLLSVNKEIDQKVKITFNNKDVQDMNLIFLKIVNSGNISILPSDFERPIEINFGEKSEIFEYDIIEVQPNNIQPDISMIGNVIILKPLLLNKSDWIGIRILASSVADELIVDSRIADVNQINNLNTNTNSRQEIASSVKWYSIGSTLFTLAIVFSIGAFINYTELSERIFAGIFILISSIGLSMTTISLFEISEYIKDGHINNIS